MAFSDTTIKQAWARSGGRCECRRDVHEHGFSRCSNRLTLDKRGEDVKGGWEARRKKPSGGDDLNNCEILCWDCFSEID